MSEIQPISRSLDCSIVLPSFNGADIDIVRAIIKSEVERQLPDAIRKVLEDDAQELETNPAFQPGAFYQAVSGSEHAV